MSGKEKEQFEDKPELESVSEQELVDDSAVVNVAIDVSTTAPPDSAEMDSAARRKLEEALEERRLQKEIQDYDFDLD